MVLLVLSADARESEGEGGSQRWLRRPQDCVEVLEVELLNSEKRGEEEMVAWV